MQIQCLWYTDFKARENEYLLKRFKLIKTWDSSLMILTERWMWSKMRTSDQSSMKIWTKWEAAAPTQKHFLGKSNMDKNSCGIWEGALVVPRAKKHLKREQLKVVWLSFLEWCTLTQKCSEELAVKLGTVSELFIVLFFD